MLLPVLGGIKVLLMMFARVVECSAPEEVQVLLARQPVTMTHCYHYNLLQRGNVTMTTLL